MISSGHLALDTESQLTGGCECCLDECVRGREGQWPEQQGVSRSINSSHLLVAYYSWTDSQGLIAKDSNNHLTDNNQQSFNEILEKS